MNIIFIRKSYHAAPFEILNLNCSSDIYLLTFKIFRIIDGGNVCFDSK